MNQLKSALATLRPSDVLTKTPRGEAEFSQRVRSLPQKVRGVLILVNGRRSVAEIESMLPILPVFGTLAALVATGYVEELPAEAPASAVPLPIQRAPVTVAMTITAANDTIAAERTPLEELREAAIAQLRGLAGEAAANLIGRIHTSRRLGELRIELQRAAQVLERFVGPEVAQIFLEEMTTRVHAVSEAMTSQPAVLAG
ncbi:hypothetical protein [Derxia gummosa]|uniref:Uncharacterized protein n=1 Tax=Derxia gummosa DSM 723 TaxID=1121388 RepID=A0A8B6X6H8_9BURK|nr:hypothetical protein [Derxia gummosa]